MSVSKLWQRLLHQEDVNFLLTNRIPRIAATRFMGWFSKIENPLVRDLSIATWKLFSDLDLSEAKRTDFRSMHDCFTRELKDGVRSVDPDPSVLTSPCDAIVGACGKVEGTTVFQVKGFPYTLEDLMGRSPLVDADCDEHLALRAAPPLTWVIEVPRTGHAEMGVQHDAVVPGELEVLSEALDLLDHTTDLRTDTLQIRRFEGNHGSPDQRRPQGRCCSVDRVALGHPSSVRDGLQRTPDFTTGMSRKTSVGCI